MIFDELVNIVGSEYVSDDVETITELSLDPDCSISRKPDCVARPGNVDEVQEIVKWANAASTPLVPISSGPPHHS